MDTWKSEAQRVIKMVVQDVGTGDVKALKKALREAYPFGLRECWPYKVWCDEVRRTLHGAEKGTLLTEDNALF